MFSIITNIYNKKTKGPTLMEFFTPTGKLKKFFYFLFYFIQLEMFEVCTTGDTAHTDTILQYSSCYHTRVNMLTHVWQQLEYHICVCRVTHGALIEHL